MKVADGASGEEELSDEICEIVDVPASFKSGVWKLSGFPTSGNKKRRKGKRPKNNMQSQFHHDYHTPTAFRNNNKS